MPQLPRLSENGSEEDLRKKFSASEAVRLPWS